MRRSTSFVAASIVVVAAASRLLVPEAAQETTKVVAQALDKTVSIPGDLTPFQAVNIHARVSGFVDSVAVDRGSWVSRCQSLRKLTVAEVISPRVEDQAKVQGMRAQQVEAEAKSISAQSTYDRLAAAAKTPGVVAGL